MGRKSKKRKYGYYKELAKVYLVDDNKVTTYIFGYDDIKDEFVFIQSNPIKSMLIEGMPATDERILGLRNKGYINLNKYLDLFDEFSAFKLMKLAAETEGGNTEPLSEEDLERFEEVRNELLAIPEKNRRISYEGF